MRLPAPYAWLANETAPRHLVQALKLYGTKETIGAGDNPVILGWAKECGLEDVYRHDLTPWCGLYVAVALKRAGREPVKAPLWARNWMTWGGLCGGGQQLGDVLVFSRSGGGGHVGFYVAEDKTHYHVLGGNQGDAVSIARIDKHRLIGCARPLYQTKPSNVRRVLVAATGVVSTNEA